jgi:hypothetical protein
MFRLFTSHHQGNVSYFIYVHNIQGARGGVMVEALSYNLEGLGFDSRWCHWIFSLT